MNFGEWFKSRKPVDVAATTEADSAQKQAEAEIMRRLAAKVVEWQMTVPAILFLESVKPLNYIGAQAMVFFEPFVQTLFNLRDYDTLRIMMEKRENVEVLLLKIEELDAEALRKERNAKAARRAARGRRRWWWPFGPKSQTPESPQGPDAGAPPPA
jgi:hypothetical protein